MDKHTKDILEALDFIKAPMATKDDLANSERNTAPKCTPVLPNPAPKCTMDLPQSAPSSVISECGSKSSKRPRKIAPGIGISMQPIAGFIAPVTIHIKHQPQSFDAEAVFIGTDVPILLGRDTFFDNYRIKFEQDHHTFEISEAPSR
jgi:hypothetical protein